MSAIARLIDTFLLFLILAFLGRAVISWLLLLGMRNETLLRLNSTLARFTEPIVAPIRRVVPSMGMFDFTPMIAIILLVFIRQIVSRAL